MVIEASSPPQDSLKDSPQDSLKDSPQHLPPGAYRLDLDLDEAHLAACVACGMCLPHCPTFRVTQEESASPRGRIALMRQVVEQGYADEHFTEFMDACVQCRGCETACPAGVDYGELMENTRVALTSQTGYQPWWRRLGYRLLGRRFLLATVSRALALLQRVGLTPRRSGLPRIPLVQRRLKPTGAGSSGVVPSGADSDGIGPDGTTVWLFTGCVMDAWMRDTHRAVQRVLEAAGAKVAFPPAGAACCGALHVHAGLGDQARRLARRTMAALAGDALILVDSAGCGAALKAYGTLLKTPEAEAFAVRVRDVHEWLAENLDRLPASTATRRRVAVLDPCHLRHVQLAHQPVHDVLRDYVEVVELDDEGLCCGAGGAYAALHPQTASAIRDRKLAVIERSKAHEVAAANPGCVLHLQAAGLSVRHPLEIVDEVLGLKC